MTAEEKLRIAYACKELHLTQSELVRRVLYGVNVKHTVVVAQGCEDALAALPPCLPSAARWEATSTSLHGTLTPAAKTPSSSGRRFLEELSALTNFRLKAEETVGELYGNHQAFKLEEL